MKVKGILKGLVLLVIPVVLMGCANNKEKSISSMDKATLIVGLDDTFAPMGFKDENGELTGFDVELAKELGKKLDKKIEFQAIDWSMKETELNAGNIDFIWNGYTITEDRQKLVEFSKPYAKNRQVIVTLADSNIKSKSDLKGKIVAAQNESSAIVAMEKEADLYNSFDGGKAVTFEDNNQALMDLEAGRVDVVVADEVLIRYYISLKDPSMFNVLEENFGDEEYGIGIKKNDIKTVEAVDKALNELRDDGTMEAISQKWFGDNITK